MTVDPEVVILMNTPGWSGTYSDARRQVLSKRLNDFLWLVTEPMVTSGIHRKPLPLGTVLSDLTSQEGCDGEPYDTMQIAVDYFLKLREVPKLTESDLRFLFDPTAKKEKL